jgi:surface antigen
MRTQAVIVVVASLALGACQTDQLGAKQTAGGLFGAVGGAVAGSQIGGGKGTVAAVAIGTILGAFIGSEIGKSLDNADKAAMAQTTQNTLETQPVGTTSTWRNPDSGHSGTVTPTKTYQAPSGEYCREYSQTVNIGGQSEEAYGKACRQPDGSWKIQN